MNEHEIPPYQVGKKGYYRKTEEGTAYPIDIVDGQLVRLTPELVAQRRGRHHFKETVVKGYSWSGIWNSLKINYTAEEVKNVRKTDR